MTESENWMLKNLVCMSNFMMLKNHLFETYTDNFMSGMSNKNVTTEAGLEGNFTNHSLRTTSATVQQSLQIFSQCSCIKAFLSCSPWHPHKRREKHGRVFGSITILAEPPNNRLPKRRKLHWAKIARGTEILWMDDNDPKFGSASSRYSCFT